MIANSGATFPILYTTENADIPKAYGVYDLHNDGVAAPAVFIIDKQGNITYSYIGNNIADRPTASDLVTEIRSMAN